MDAKTAASRLNVLFSDASNDDYPYTELYSEAVQEGIKALNKVEQLEKENKQLKNRCKALTYGAVCLVCPFECENRTEEYRGDTDNNGRKS